MDENRDTSCGRMCREPLAVTQGGTSRQSSQKLSELQNQTPLMCHCLTSDGRWQTSTAETAGLLPTGCTMRNIGEYPSEERESTLSQILEETVPEKYNLSATACAGILRRAQERGKKLPELLESTLRNQARQSA